MGDHLRVSSKTDRQSRGQRKFESRVGGLADDACPLPFTFRNRIRRVTACDSFTGGGRCAEEIAAGIYALGGGQYFVVDDLDVADLSAHGNARDVYERITIQVAVSSWNVSA